ncbi:hypothetical protein Aduo_016519 [Ancylostoma duodenale]
MTCEAACPGRTTNVNITGKLNFVSDGLFGLDNRNEELIIETTRDVSAIRTAAAKAFDIMKTIMSSIKNFFGIKEPLYLNIGEEAPVVANVDRHGFFRQNYDDRGWKNIIKQLEENHEIYSENTRFGLISDAFAAAQIDRVDYETVFQLLEYLSKEKSNLVWYLVERKLEEIVNFYGNEPDRKWAQSYAVMLVGEPLRRASRNINSEEQEEVKGRMSDTNEKISNRTGDLTKGGQQIRKNPSKRSDEHKTSESSLNE